MKDLIIFVGLLSITLGFPAGSPLYKRERRRRQLGYGYGHGHGYGNGYGYGQVYPFYVPFLQSDHFNDFTPEIYIHDNARPPIRRPATPRPAITPLRRPTTSMVRPVPFSGFQTTGERCPPARDDDLNNHQLPVFVYVDPREWSSMGADRPPSAGQSGSNDLQPAFAIVPGVFLPVSEDSQVTQNPIPNSNPLKSPDPLRVDESGKKEKDC